MLHYLPTLHCWSNIEILKKIYMNVIIMVIRKMNVIQIKYVLNVNTGVNYIIYLIKLIYS